MSHFWNREKQKYYDTETGKPVPPAALRSAVEALSLALLLLFSTRAKTVLSAAADFEADAATSEIYTAALKTWNEETRRELSAAHLAMVAVAFGGFQNASGAALEIGEQFARVQLGFFNQFAAGVFSGAIPLNGTFTARTEMYAAAVYPSYENAVRARMLGSNPELQERRVLGAADHCPTCVTQASLGYQRIGTLKAIGNSECLSRCRCFFQFRNAPTP